MPTTESQDTFGNRSLDHTVSLVVAFLLAQTSVLYTCYEAGYIEGLRSSNAFITEFPYTLNGLHILISFGLVVCTIGLCLRRGAGLAISSLALVSILAIYGHWHFRTVKYLSDFQTDVQLYNRVREEVGFFHGATRWDFVVLVIVGILLLWHLIKLTRITVPKMKY